MSEGPKKQTKLPDGRYPHETIVSKEEAAKMKAELPPAGYQRDEELAKRQATLDEAKEQIAAAGETMNIDPSTLKEEREILQHFSRDPFTGGFDPDVEGLNTQEYAYKFVQCEAPRSSPHRAVYQAKRFGWELVTPSVCHTSQNGKRVPVGSNLPVHAILGARYIGDTVLMFMSRGRFDELQRLEQQYRNRMVLAAQATSMHRRYGAQPHTELDDPKGYVRQLLRQGGPVAMSPVRTVAQELARGAAESQFNQMLRDGTVPGREMKR